jgi:uncharacterized protein (TIGR03118 family)
MESRAMRLMLRLAAIAAFLLPATSAVEAGSTGYLQTNLVTDNQSITPAKNTDPNLKNPWGISFSNASPFWVSDQRTGVSTLYNGAGVPQPLVVTIPPPAGSTAGGSPTGTVNNGTTDFKLTPAANSTAVFLFATLNGNISGWNPNVNPTNAVNEVTTPGAVYTGLALASNGMQNQLYAVDNAAGPGHSTIDVFGPSFAPVTSGGFVDPNLPAGFTPYNIQLINGKLFVTYEGPGATGLIDVFDTNGNLLQRFSADSHLAQPWGMALAPSAFGQFGGDLLVGNKANGQINAFDPTTGAFLGTLMNASGQPIADPGLWGLAFGTGSQGFDPNTLYFTAGIGSQGGNIYSDGLFGAISVVPEPPSAILLGLGMILLAGASHWRARRRRWGSEPILAAGSDPRPCDQVALAGGSPYPW